MEGRVSQGARPCCFLRDRAELDGVEAIFAGENVRDDDEVLTTPGEAVLHQIVLGCADRAHGIRVEGKGR